MALHSDLPIYRTGVRLLALVLRAQEQMPRGIKRSLGDKITNHGVEMLDLMALANATQHNERADFIRRLMTELRAMTVLLRVSHDSRYVSTKLWAESVALLDSIGKQGGGWLNDLDQYVKHRLRAPHYVRYVDDFILLHPSSQWLNESLRDIATFLPQQLQVRLNPRKTILQPVDRGVDFVGHVIKPWHRTTRPGTVAKAIARMQQLPAADVHQVANSYFGLLRQASHSHQDRAQLANAVRQRGHCITGNLTKAYP